MTEAAAIIGVTIGRLSQIVAAGGIAFIRVGRQVMIRKDVAEAFREQDRPRGRPKK